MDIQKYIIDQEKTILEAMQHLNQSAVRVLFITKENRLQAVVSDGDVRRWIINGGDLHAAVKLCANYEPKYLMNISDESALDFLKKNSIEAVPIVDENMHIQRIVRWDQKSDTVYKEQINIPVVVMAGGKGTRLYPYTKILPKPLIPVGEIPIAEHIMNQFFKYGCENFYLIVNHKKNMIKAYFSEVISKYNIIYIDEDIPLGTAGGLNLLKGKISSTFILTNCDILVKENYAEIYKFHKECSNLITMICAIRNIQLPYGIVNIGQGGRIESMEEKPSLSFMTNTGCYMVEPEVIEDMEENTKVDFPDIIQKYRRLGKRVGVFPVGEDAWMDMGQLEELDKMRTKLDC